MYLRKESDLIKIKTSVAINFYIVRRQLLKKLTCYGVNIMKRMNDETFGGSNDPIDLSHLNIDLADVALMCKILDDDEHESVMSLTE